MIGRDHRYRPESQSAAWPGIQPSASRPVTASDFGPFDPVQTRGLLTRTRDSDDRRVTWVRLTEKGHELAVRTHCEVTARTSELVSKLSLTDQRQLTDVVRRLLDEAG